MRPQGAGRALLLLAVLASGARPASAREVEIAPFVGAQYAGSFGSPLPGGDFSSGIGFDFGGTADFALAPGWRIEAMYSRQQAELSNFSARRFEMTVERYMAGIVEEHGEGPSRFFGVGLIGVTRFAPGRNGRDDDYRFTLGASLGLKQQLSARFGLRLEGRGFYVVTSSAGGAVCSGSCVFFYTSNGLWQADAAAGVYIRF